MTSKPQPNRSDDSLIAALSRRTFRIFISSTFDDFKLERDALQQDVFPRIARLCRQSNVYLQPVDLRWGVSDAAVRDRQTMGICLREVDRCAVLSPRVFFLLLLGERYGWRPIPERLRAELVKPGLGRLSHADRLLFSQTYELDENAVPPTFVLQPGDDEQTEELRLVIERALAANPHQPGTIDHTASAVELEAARAGVTGDAPLPPNVFCLARTIRKPDKVTLAPPFVDPAGGGAENDAGTRQENLRGQIKGRLGDAFVEYHADWAGNGISDAHIAGFCEQAYALLSKAIGSEIAALPDPKDPEVEEALHRAFGAEHIARQVGSSALVSNIVTDADRRPIPVLWLEGEPGAGKTATMAAIAHEMESSYRDAIVIRRFVGATATSSDGMSILQSILQELARKADGEKSTTADVRYDVLAGRLRANLEKIGSERKIALIIDGLDKLDEGDLFRTLSWIPADPPKNTQVFLSASQPGDLWQVGSSVQGRRKKVQPLYYAEEAFLNKQLGRWGRTVTAEQRARLLAAAKNDANPLFMMLLALRARRCHSTEVISSLPTDILSAVVEYFDHLSSEETHGQPVTHACLSLITASRDGLTEPEVLDLLSPPFGDKVFSAFLETAKHHAPPVPRMPFAVWARLRNDLDPFLQWGSGLQLRFAHSVFDQVIKSHLEAAYRNARDVLVRYFGSQDDWHDKGQPNTRKARELPYLLAYSERPEDLSALSRLLRDLEFIEAKCAAGLVHDLIADYDRALSRSSDREPDAGDVSVFARWIRSAQHVINEDPTQLLQAAANSRLELVSRSARELLRSRGQQHPWFALRDADHAAPPRVTFQTQPQTSGALTFLDDRHLISVHSTEIRCWDVRSGAPVWIRNTTAKSGCHNGFAISADGRTVFQDRWRTEVCFVDGTSGRIVREIEAPHGRGGPGVLACDLSRDGTVAATTGSAATGFCAKIWDVKTGRLRHEIPGFSNFVFACALSPDGSKLAVGLEEVGIWSTGDGSNLLAFPARGMTACAWSTDGTRLLTGTYRGKIEVWCLDTRQRIFQGDDLGAHTQCCALSPDGRTCAVGLQGGRLTLIRLKGTGAKLKRDGALVHLTGHSRDVTAVAFSEEGDLLASMDSGGVVQIWDTDVAESALPPFDQTEGIWACEFSPCGSRIAVGGAAGPLVVSDVDSAEVVTKAAFEHPKKKNKLVAVFCCAFSPDGTEIAAGAQDGRLAAWPIGSHSPRVTFSGHEKTVRHCAYSPDGNHLLSTSRDGSIRIWKVETGQEIARHDPPEKPSRCAWAADGSRVFVGLDGKLMVLSRDLTPITAVDVYRYTSPFPICVNGRNLIVDGHETVVIDLDRNSKTTLDVERFSTAAVTPDGQYLLTGTHDGNVELADLQTGQRLAGHRMSSEVRAVAVHPRGDRIAVADYGGDVRILELRNLKLGAPSTPPAKVFRPSRVQKLDDTSPKMTPTLRKTTWVVSIVFLGLSVALPFHSLWWLLFAVPFGLGAVGNIVGLLFPGLIPDRPKR